MNKEIFTVLGHNIEAQVPDDVTKEKTVSLNIGNEKVEITIQSSDVHKETWRLHTQNAITCLSKIMISLAKNKKLFNPSVNFYWNEIWAYGLPDVHKDHMNRSLYIAVFNAVVQHLQKTDPKCMKNVVFAVTT